MVQDDRSSVGGEANSSFDLNSQAGVLLVLQAIRSSELSVPKKNELRDLVFLYANDGGDPAMQNMLEERLRASQITPALVPVFTKKEVDNNQPNTTAYQAGFSGGRPAPVFTPVAITEQRDGVVQQNTITQTQPETENKKGEETSVPHVQPDLAPSFIPPEPIKAELPRIKPQTISSQSADEKAKAESASVSPISLDRLSRIREIKADINNKVGNPVNLIDIDNNLGREYMTSLLEAMKLLNGGSENDITKSMQRLEVVYEQVKTLIELNEVKDVPELNSQRKIDIIEPIQPTPIVLQNQQASRPVIVSRITPITPSLSPTPPVPEIKKTIHITPPTISARQQSASVMEVKPVLAPKPAPETVVTQSIQPDIQKVPVIPRPAPLLPPVEPMTKPSLIGEVTPLVSPVTMSSAPVEENISADKSPADVDQVIPIVSTRHGIGVPVADAVPLRTPQDLPSADSLKTSSQGENPLYTDEIDNGLDQLLSEWVLFKRSGLFGTGPKGREHPLFKKIAEIQMPLLLSGRFEGYAPEIKQSITDYMNGWRYEQGIIYEPGETFEQYLRRVIRHIIDWQNKKRAT
ncbi:hypothetical protein CO026_02470 [Candidatus Kaiserbacteria bacterium CG_4_9_14_0_2_um_filter_41_32]|uniref:Uncharacterized protein n=1 Tax=Candidatus Kaiserbacteria bacterium CG_4_9_14_0_2_um_filter_41_32 TaxID=1974601 RepID=A0A2M8FEI4_9BACT|nr:MAG: hypothetical protein CO026_02470 [Candidatus Kaiserbacteria bacterium CG_4_9_14_0_2_um_filter_41_32]